MVQKNCLKAVVLFGPTAVGKSGLAVELAKQLNAEIISADSMQIYKGLNIGSAKITEAEMQGVKHHLLDFVSPNCEYSVNQFVKDATKLIKEISGRGHLPIVVGGTGLYIKALTQGYSFDGGGKNAEIRDRYEKLCDEKGLSYLYEILKQKNAARAQQIHPNDKKRIIRALEIAETATESHKNENNQIRYVIFGLTEERQSLYEKINARVDKMFVLGLENEVSELLNSGIDEKFQCMQGIGYKELISYFKGDETLEKTKEIIKQRTRNYAKRQLTFMRGMPEVIWVETKNAKEEILKILL